jgi:phosphate-transporting ATPase
MRAIADLDPNEGQVFLGDTLREAFSGPAWRRQVVYVPAESGWWSERVVDHFPDWHAAQSLAQALLLPSAAREWSVQQLSTGERQRLALVRALVLQPRVLLLDEPTSGLDPAAAGAVEQILRERASRGVGVLWVTHDASQARRVARRCLYLDAGHAREGAP